MACRVQYQNPLASTPWPPRHCLCLTRRGPQPRYPSYFWDSLSTPLCALGDRVARTNSIGFVESVPSCPDQSVE